MFPFTPPLNNTFPSLLQAIRNTRLACPMNERNNSPRSPSHTNSSPVEPPPPQLANCRPSGLQAIPATLLPCPTRVWSSIPSSARHIRTVRSSLQLASRQPSGLHTTSLIGSVCALPTQQHTPVAVFQTRTV